MWLKFFIHLLCDLLIVRRARFAVAKVAELADALVLGASGATRGSSSLPFRTIFPEDAFRRWLTAPAD